MPEKKVQTEKAKTTVVGKPVVKKTVAETTAVVTKTKSAVTKAASVKTTSTKASPAKSTTPKEKKVAVAIPDVKASEVKATPVIVTPKVVPETGQTAGKSNTKKIATGTMLTITLIKSGIGYSKRHKATLRALGLRRLNQTITQVDSLSLRGMLAKVDHLVRIEEQVKK